MRYLYSAGILVYNWLLFIASAFNPKAAKIIRGRRESFRRIRDAFSEGDRVFWFHCASLGEFEQGRPVIEKVKEEEPAIKILLTFYSSSGFEIRHDYDKADCVAYLPADTRRNARKLLKLAGPEKTVFVKYEFWYNYLAVLQKNKVPVYLISGIFRPSQPFFRWYGSHFLKILGGFRKLYVQDENSAKILDAHSINNYTVSGDTRFDRVMSITSSSAPVKRVEKFRSGSRLIVAGSTWHEEEEMIARFIREEDNDLKWVIAPHNISAPNIERIQKLITEANERYTEAEDDPDPGTRVLIIDTIGLLSSVYRYADIAVIGGGFGRGIHNILEAATWSVPILFGPNHKRFREAVDLIQEGGAMAFEDYDSFSLILRDLLSDEDKIARSGEINFSYVKDNLGATGKISSDLLTTSG